MANNPPGVNMTARFTTSRPCPWVEPRPHQDARAAIAALQSPPVEQPDTDGMPPNGCIRCASQWNSIELCDKCEREFLEDLAGKSAQAEAQQPSERPNYALEYRMDKIRRDQVRENVREMEERAEIKQASDGLVEQCAKMADGLRGSMWANRNEIIALLDAASAALQSPPVEQPAQAEGGE